MVWNREVHGRAGLAHYDMAASLPNLLPARPLKYSNGLSAGDNGKRRHLRNGLDGNFYLFEGYSSVR